MAERAGAVSVMALERIPADIKKDGGIARASDPSMIREIMEATSIPVMAKARIGHFAEAQVGRLVGEASNAPIFKGQSGQDKFPVDLDLRCSTSCKGSG